MHVSVHFYRKVYVMQTAGNEHIPPTSVPTTESERQQFITFTVEDREYGIDIMSIREIKGWSQTTSLPNAPHYMRGVINLRGTVVPIIDLRARFNMGVTQAGKNHVVMIVHVGKRLMGVLVDAVSDILTIETQMIRPVPIVHNNQKNDILKGLVSLENRMVGLLTLERLFDKDSEFHDHSSQFLDHAFQQAQQQEQPPSHLQDNDAP